MVPDSSPAQIDEGGVTTNRPASMQELESCLLTSAAIIQGLRAVEQVIPITEVETDTIVCRPDDFQKQHPNALSLQGWLDAADLLDHDGSQSRCGPRFRLTIVLAYLRQMSKNRTGLSPSEISKIWSQTLRALHYHVIHWKLEHRASGWYQIPLWKLRTEDETQEQMFLHVWMPHEKENPVAQDSHVAPSYTQTWSLTSQELPTGNTFELEALHAAIVFDQSVPDFETPRTVSELPVVDIVDAIMNVRAWEELHKTGLYHSDRGEWEEALRSYRTALHHCHNWPLLSRPCYEHVSLGKIGHMYRMLGLYSKACEALEKVVINTPQSRFRVDSAGELAMVYRHMDRLADSKRAAEDQYRGAKELDLAKFACRSIGNVGMVNYQLYLENKDPELLEEAINQLNERVQRAQQIGDVALEAIGQSRLSLCYIAKGDYETAVEAARQNYALMCKQPDATKVGFAKAFLGRSLHVAGQESEALAVFNQAGGCPPIIALCKEISSEHRLYIIEMINAGADLKMRDEQGYSALECAVYNGDEETANIIRAGLRTQITRESGNITQEMEQFEYESTLRKGYRDMFQDRLRPVLLRKDQSATLRDLRDTYAAGLAEDTKQGKIFDKLKYVRYADFVQWGRLPASYDSSLDFNTVVKDPFILFFSYRWIAKDPGTKGRADTPDDDQHTQYKRMLRAAEKFLQLHSEVKREQLCIWIDFACVDQSNTQPGVAALPMNLAQCNAMISLIDDTYYERSWCCVEVLMIQTLLKSYGLHLWHEHVVGTETTEEHLRPGSLELQINLAEKKVTYEVDRAKLHFLERQTRLLG